MKLRVLDIDVLLIRVSITDGRRLILHYIGILPFFTAAIFNTQKWRVGPKISSVNISILNQGGSMNNIIPLPEGPKFVHGDPPTLFGNNARKLRISHGLVNSIQKACRIGHE